MHGRWEKGELQGLGINNPCCWCHDTLKKMSLLSLEKIIILWWCKLMCLSVCLGALPVFKACLPRAFEGHSSLLLCPSVNCGCLLSHFSRVRLYNPLDYSPPGSSVHGILQDRTLEWVAMPSLGDLPWFRGGTHLSSIFCIVSWALYHWCHLASEVTDTHSASHILEEQRPEDKYNRAIGMVVWGAQIWDAKPF